MRTFKWLVAGGILAVSGLSLAHETKTKQEAEESAEEMKRDAQEAGEDQRTSFDEAQQKAEEKGEETAERAEEKTQEIGEKTAGRAEAIGSGVADSVSEATSAATGEPSRLERGMTNRGEISSTVTTDALGLIAGDGLNATLSYSFTPKISGVAGAEYSRTSAGAAGAVTKFGVRTGADYFILGKNNEGLRIGPRLELGLGGSSLGDGGGFANLGAGAEVGYNWISSRGLTAGAGLGMRGLIGGGAANSGDEDGNFLDNDLGAYGSVNLGYSW